MWFPTLIVGGAAGLRKGIVRCFDSIRAYNVPMSDSAEFIAHGFVRGINRQDAEELAGMMTENHRFIDSLGNAMEGRDAVRAAWMRYFRMVPDYTIAVEETFVDGPAVVMLGLAQGTFVPDGQMRAENRWETPAAFRALVEEGKVAEWRVYADNEPIRRLMR